MSFWTRFVQMHLRFSQEIVRASSIKGVLLIYTISTECINIMVVWVGFLFLSSSTFAAFSRTSALHKQIIPEDLIIQIKITSKELTRWRLEQCSEIKRLILRIWSTGPRGKGMSASRKPSSKLKSFLGPMYLSKYESNKLNSSVQWLKSPYRGRNIWDAGFLQNHTNRPSYFKGKKKTLSFIWG